MKLIRMQAACAGIVLLLASAGSAQTIRLGDGSGAAFDGILDGFPGIAPQDGEPDFGGNALGVGLRVGATEERGVGEFSLASLGGVGASQIAAATLRFNIDDVLSTFGPGTDFSGLAAAEILVYVFDGNGAVDVADFSRTERQAHVVDTTVHGAISDATLRQTGPLSFTVDITSDLRAVVTAGGTAVGVVWRTMDTPTGTSIDNLGESSLGPPGVGGAAMPYIEIELAAEASPTATRTATAAATSTVASSPTTTPTHTPPPSATPSPTRPPGSCIGDCNQSRSVSVNELVIAVNIALGQMGVEECGAADFDGDADVAINELIQAVSAALGGCD